MTAVDRELAEYERICTELASLHIELGGMQVDLERTRAYQFQQLNDGSRNITQIQRELDATNVDVSTELISLRALITAKEARLRYLDQSLACARTFPPADVPVPNVVS